MAEISKFTKGIINKQVLSVVTDYGNPDLVLKILYTLMSDQYINLLPDKIGASQEETEHILDFLAINELIKYIGTSKEHHDSIEARATDETRVFLGSDLPFGERRLFESELDEIDTARIMTAIEDIADFNYSRQTIIAVEKLDDLRKETAASLKAIKEKEERTLRALLGLEEYEIIALGPSFASENNPIWDDHVGNLTKLGVGITLAYKLVRDAFIHGFQEAEARLRLDAPIECPYLHKEPKTHSIPVLDVTKFREKYRVHINNPLYWAMNEYNSFAYFQAVAKKVDQLVERLTPIIPEMKKPIHRQK